MKYSVTYRTSSTKKFDNFLQAYCAYLEGGLIAQHISVCNKSDYYVFILYENAPEKIKERLNVKKLDEGKKYWVLMHDNILRVKDIVLDHARGKISLDECVKKCHESSDIEILTSEELIENFYDI